MLIGDAVSVFRAGKKLTNATTWKNGQLLGSTLVTLIGGGLAIAAAFGYKINLDGDGISAISLAVVAVVGLFNGGVTVATTTSIGLPPAPSDPPSNGSDRGIDRGIEGRRSVDPDVHPEVPVVVEEKKPDLWQNRSLG